MKSIKLTSLKKYLILIILIIVYSKSYSEIYDLKKAGKDSTLYCVKFDKKFYHTYSLELILFSSGIAKEYFWKNGNKKLLLLGHWVAFEDSIIINNSYEQSKGIDIIIDSLGYSNGNNVRLYNKFNNKQLTDFFIQFKDTDSLIYGFETDIQYSYLKHGREIRICSDNGGVCTKWFKVPNFKSYIFFINLDFDYNFYGRNIKYLLFKQLDNKSLKLLKIDADR